MNLRFWQKIKDSYHWRPWHAYILLALAIILVYGCSLFFDYSYLDDQKLILEHSAILERANFEEIFFNDVFFSADKIYYRPLLTLSLAFDWHWGGGTVFAFHFTNLALHFLAVCLLLILLRLLDIRDKVAVWLALLFAVHPALVQAVAWIPGRNDILAAIFIFSTLIFLSRWFRREHLFDLICLWIFFLLALLTKETAVLLPLFALAWVFIFERHYFNWLKLGLGAAGAAVSGLIWYLLRLAALGGSSVGQSWSSFCHVLLSPIIFLGKVFFPVNLSVYPVPADTPWFYGAAALLILALLLFFSRPLRRPRLFFGLAWFWFFLALGSIRPDSDLFRNYMEQRLYVPLFGLLLILAETENFWRRFSVKWRERSVILLIIIFALLAWHHSFAFSDRFRFWQQAVASSPHSPLSQRNLGAMYYLAGDLDKAEPLFQQALTLNPDEPMAHNNLAAIYIDRGDLWRAEIELKKELAVNPNYDVALYNLGRVYYERRRYQEATALWQETLRLNPGYQPAALGLEKLKITCPLCFPSAN